MPSFSLDFRAFRGLPGAPCNKIGTKYGTEWRQVGSLYKLQLPENIAAEMAGECGNTHSDGVTFAPEIWRPAWGLAIYREDDAERLSVAMTR